jgi:2-polyprenyl-3-methyl-5-hydroxy-6-metoxy-1,4-benzoquinol methylase
VDPELQAANAAVWSAGHWDDVADFISAAGPPLLEALAVGRGQALLDVGAGTGTALAIPAALRGADVVASDLVEAHFEDGRRRAAAAGARDFFTRLGERTR